MDANQFKQFMAQQATMMDKIIEKIRVREAPAGAPVLPVPTPSPLMVDGDMEENFDFFERSWEEYVKATSMNTWPATADIQKVSYLLSVIGEPARKKFFNFELTEAERATPALALKAIR
ncbi:tetratricopeptide repeat protein, tpr [Culex quinquefasciatus]|uniref:Tetratricopeptide repeat protein, tpr n=1 Tax=Culex quinquefasciatus TaxID=7176 RepID=B0XF92_CULQU|nr:tetratricopeptide repeat protein, tpr [Culex quinquefasciatus]|eukprot:XP_001868314.1 tetratricopeptide repeat protein, tpr [Culex quinquefasciatus]